MQSLNISLPEPLKELVDGQIAAGLYSSASEYVRELIRVDEKRKAEERLETLLLKGCSTSRPRRIYLPSSHRRLCRTLVI